MKLLKIVNRNAGNLQLTATCSLNIGSLKSTLVPKNNRSFFCKTLERLRFFVDLLGVETGELVGDSDLISALTAFCFCFKSLCPFLSAIANESA